MPRRKSIAWVKLVVGNRLHRPHPSSPWLDAKNQPCSEAEAVKFQNELRDIYPVSYIKHKFHA